MLVRLATPSNLRQSLPSSLRHTWATDWWVTPSQVPTAKPPSGPAARPSKVMMRSPPNNSRAKLSSSSASGAPGVPLHR